MNNNIEQINLSDFYIPTKSIMSFDISPLLKQELLLVEKEFREKIEVYDFQPYAGKIVRIINPKKSLIAHWAYMILAQKLHEVGAKTYIDHPNLELEMMMDKLHEHNWSQYQGKRVFIKGCSEISFETSIYAWISQKLVSEVRALSYGEKCSLVPIYKI
ncbi:MAG: DUF2480 family protein [Chitinophagales bacterium]|jgi:hypothetical protein|nr:DUF2480 family protein [Chitinophagales bacterium]